MRWDIVFWIMSPFYGHCCFETDLSIPSTYHMEFPFHGDSRQYDFKLPLIRSSLPFLPSSSMHQEVRHLLLWAWEYQYLWIHSTHYPPTLPPSYPSMQYNLTCPRVHMRVSSHWKISWLAYSSKEITYKFEYRSTQNQFLLHYYYSCCSDTV